MKPIYVHPLSALLGAAALGLVLGLTAMAQQPVDQSLIPGATGVRPSPPELKDLLSHISIIYLDDGQGGKAKTIRFTGVNVQIVNGLGATNGNLADPSSLETTSTNSVGNLIVGYNEPAVTNNRTGSHNLVVGQSNDYLSFGGLLAGSQNAISAPYASITAGSDNTVRAEYSGISGGAFNEVDVGAKNSSISGGLSGRIHSAGLGAPGWYSAICGGEGNLISGGQSAVLVGGTSNSCESDRYSVVVGGDHNRVQSAYAVVVGGTLNRVLQNTGAGFRGQGSVVVGGRENEVQGMESTICGGRHNVIDPWSSSSSISGGDTNAVVGATSAVVGGGHGREVYSADDWRAGDLFQED